MEQAFGSEFTVGVEEELFLVGPPELELVDDAEQVLAAMNQHGSWQADHEAFTCEIELRSPPSQTPGDAVAALHAGREAARDAGATTMAAGLHPTSEFGGAQLVRAARYAHVEGSMRGLIKRSPECALHVHVGMPDPETAIRVFNGLREWLPLLEALAANSPWWHGIDSGMASARAAFVRAYPSRGIPRELRDWEDYQGALEAAAAGGGPTDYTLIWWDVRLHPRLGTVEVREMDVQSRLDDSLGLAALVQALARMEAESERERAPTEAISWSAFLAARDGLDAEILRGGGLRPAREAAREALELARPHSPEPDALDAVERILADGGGADRRRAAHRRGGMKAMLEELVAETAG
jgi:carboxylate-amine ligase